MAAIWIGVCALLSAAFSTSTLATVDEEDLVGQRSEVKATSKYILEAAEFAKQNTSLSHLPFKVEKAEQQAVGGLLLHLTIIFGLDMQTDLTTCKAVVYSRPWEEFMNRTSFECNSMI